MDTFVDLHVRKHVDRVVRALLKEQCAAPEPVNVRDTLLVVQPNDDDMKALVGVWDKAYWWALQGTAKGPFLVDATPEVLVGNARKIADATVALFWDGLVRLKD